MRYCPESAAKAGDHAALGRLIVAPGLIGYGLGLVILPQHAAHLADHRGDGTVVGALHRGKMLVGDADFIGKGPLRGGQSVVFILCALDGTADIRPCRGLQRVQFAHQRRDLGVALGVGLGVDVTGVPRCGTFRSGGLPGAWGRGEPVAEQKLVVPGNEFLFGAAAQQGGQCAADHSEGQQTDDAVCVLHDLLQNLFLRNTAFSHFIREKAF